MSIAIAQPHHIFGLKATVRGNIAYLDEQTIVYPSGANCILYDTNQNTQKFIPRSAKSVCMTAMAVSPNRRYVAIAERGEKAAITIHELDSLRKRKTLSSNEVQASEYVSLTFSNDFKYLVALGGHPDWALTFWSWEKAKMMASTKVATQQINSPIYQVSFNPQDNTQLCVVGYGILKLFRYSEGNLKQVSFQKMEPQNYLCQAWIADDRMVVGTDQGHIMLLEAGELKKEFNVGTQQKQACNKDISLGTLGDDHSTNTGPPQITSIVTYSKGFACACGAGLVQLFEKTDDKDFFKKTREILIPQDPNSFYPSKAENQVIKCLAVSPSEENLMCSTDMNQLYTIIVSAADIGKSDQVKFEMLSQSFHSGQVTGLDVCIRKPLIATSSVDRSIRIWNFESCNLEVYKEFVEEAHSIALHPSGLYVLVGFTDELRLMNLLIDDIRAFKEFSIRGCKECSFNNGGSLFAAVDGNIIQIYSATTFENVANLKGHSRKVRAVVWSADDIKIVSCGMDGALYEWDVITGRRVSESILKSCYYSSVAVTPDGKTTFAVGSDKTLKEVSDSKILREVDANDIMLVSVVMSHSGHMLFVGTSTGVLRSMKYPLTIPGKWQQYQGHGTAITKMKITYDDQFLITVGEDACVVIWKIQDKGRHGLTHDKEMNYAEEVLITKSDMEEKNTTIVKLTAHVDELKTENDYQLKLQTMQYNECLKECNIKFTQEMQLLNTKNQALKMENDQQEVKQKKELSEHMERHAQELQDLEYRNNQKLMFEYDKYQELQAKSQKMHEGNEHQLQDMEAIREHALEELSTYYETKLQKATVTLDQLHEEICHQHRKYDVTQKQIEDDADCEILQIKNTYEKKLQEVREAYTNLKKDTGRMSQKSTSLINTIEDQKKEIKKMQTENNTLKTTTKHLEKDITSLKKVLLEREETVQDKEKRICNLKQKNQELEKFKFVLDYKINELKNQIEPRDNDIRAMSEQIHAMEIELEGLSKQNTQLELNITEQQQKLKATEKEMHQERQQVHYAEVVVRRFKTDLHTAVGYIQDPTKLKEAVCRLYETYEQEHITESDTVDADIQKEYTRQRKHFERSIASLRRQLSNNNKVHDTNHARIMQENVSLIKEINDLRQELKITRSQVHNLEVALGLHCKSTRADAGKLLAQVMANSKNAQLERDLSEKVKIIQLQQDKILELHRKLCSQSDSGLPTRLPDGNKLPPVMAK